MTLEKDPENGGNQTRNVLSTKTRDPQLPPMQLLAYGSVSGASIAIIIYIIYLLLHCGCK
jgi:hypothetical protein